jgi:hypothetical protein
MQKIKNQNFLQFCSKILLFHPRQSKKNSKQNVYHQIRMAIRLFKLNSRFGLNHSKVIKINYQEKLRFFESHKLIL